MTPSAQPNAWQPIETAPKDNTRVLVYGGTYSVGDHEDLEAGGICIASWRNWGGWLDDSEYEGQEIWRKPTHWQPLPEPPSA